MTSPVPQVPSISALPHQDLADLALSVSLVVVTKPSTPSPRQAQAAHTGRGRHIILCARRMGPLEQCKKQRESRRSGVIDEIS